MKKLFLILLLSLFLVNSVSAICTVTFDKETYKPSETVTATMLCNQHPDESTKAYTLNWTNSTGHVIESDTGTTLKADGTNPSYQTYILPATYSGIINATLTGTNLGGTDEANVTGSDINSLIISDASFAVSAYVGKLFSLVFTVKDENSQKIDGASCVVYSTDNTGAPLQTGGRVITKDGRGMVDDILNTIHHEGREYIARVRCSCGPANTSIGCTDEDGLSIGASAGSNSYPFTVGTWLNVNTVTGKSNYIAKEEIFICANVTNIGRSERIPLHIQYQVRCSSGTDLDSNLDRVLIIDSEIDKPDMRGISTNTTQMQCKKFVVPEPRFLQGKSSQCYASTNTWVLNEKYQEILGYTTISPFFNITISDLQIQVDWQRNSNYEFSSAINLSSGSYNDYSGVGSSNIDVRLDSIIASINPSEQEILPGINLNSFINLKYIKNFTTTYCNGTTVSSGLEITDDGDIELEIRNVDISPTGCYNVNLTLNSFEERQSIALEGIENKTGTFHLDVACPSTGTIGDDMSCVLTAYAEDSQTIEKEVDFTCHISDGTSTYSAVNFNQMVTRTPVALTNIFAIPSNFTSGQQYVLQCYADYYNLGSRRDSFYDTFTASMTSTGGRSNSPGEDEDSPENGTGNPAPITGGIIGTGDKPLDGNIWNPFTPKGKIAYLLFGGFLIILLATILIITRIKTKNIHYHPPRKQKRENKKILLKILLGVTGLLIVSGIAALIIWSYGIITNVQVSSLSENTFKLIQDPLFRTMIFMGFITFLIIITFKLLNIKANIKIGHESPVEKYWKKQHKD